MNNLSITYLRKRAGELLLGHTINTVWDYGFDYLLYPAVIWYSGPVWGSIIMAFASLAICLALLRLYDWSKRDWLGIEAIKSLKGYSGASRSGRVMAWLLRQSDPVACVLLSIKFDPFIVTTYMRQGAFTGMARRDWYIFFLSWLIGNVWWSVVCISGITAVEWLWRFVKDLIG